jgi:hypothetical protein
MTRSENDLLQKMNTKASEAWIDFDYAMLHLVPHVHLGACEVVGVVLHARTGGFIGMRFAVERNRLAARWPELDIDLVQRELLALQAIASGTDVAGPIGALTASERFHWITAPRSAVLQPSEVHAGRTTEPETTLDELFAAIRATR